ncbi:hypothetical protein H5410_041370 [Solanum commersonii]|uniref:Uncharacterized protein n=1 Tax=Solanum commersonii TaxID=4109 RepID=A0A9J5XUK2_SOLCO|nr:hypothetical protein H5410_041370 [Solanum commersonii]
METDMSTRLITIWGEVVDYGSEEHNALYGLLDHDLEAFKVKDCVSGTWLASNLCSGKNVPQATTKAKFICSNFAVEARTWMSIVRSRISPSGNISNIQADPTDLVLVQVSVLVLV